MDDRRASRIPVTATPFEYADFGSRLWGMLIDGALLMVAMIVVSPLLAVRYAGPILLFPGTLVVLLVLAWRRGASPGMRVAHIRLADAKTGGLPRSSHLVPRAIAALVYFGSVIFGGPFVTGLVLYFMMVGALGPPNEEHRLALSEGPEYLVLTALLVAGTFANLWMLWDRRRQTLIDKICGLVMLKQPAPPPAAEEGKRPPTGSTLPRSRDGHQPGAAPA